MATKKPKDSLQALIEQAIAEVPSGQYVFVEFEGQKYAAFKDATGMVHVENRGI